MTLWALSLIYAVSARNLLGMSRGVCENLSHSGVLFPITKCKYGSNFNFTCIKIRNLLVTQLTEEKTKKRKKEAQHCGIRKDRAGLLSWRSGEEGSVGISWKAISSSWVVAAKKTFCLSLFLSLSLSLSSYCAALPRFGGKPGENQSAKLEYKPISGGVGNVRSSHEEKDREKRANERERRGESNRGNRQISKEATLSTRL